MGSTGMAMAVSLGSAGESAEPCKPAAIWWILMDISGVPGTRRCRGYWSPEQDALWSCFQNCPVLQHSESLGIGDFQREFFCRIMQYYGLQVVLYTQFSACEDYGALL